MSHETTFPSPELPSVPSIEGYHVTDDPNIVINALRQGIPLDRGIDVSHDDLLASGLYFSEVPHLWVGRSSNKWKFVSSLNETQRSSIVQAITKDSRFTSRGYLTDSERERATSWLERFITDGNSVYLQFLADQPYNFPSWKPKFLAQFDIVNNDVPQIVPVKVQGLFADVSSARISHDLIRHLRGNGYDGAFYTNIGLLPQAVVWNNAAVVQFGDYTAE